MHSLQTAGAVRSGLRLSKTLYLKKTFSTYKASASRNTSALFEKHTSFSKYKARASRNQNALIIAIPV